MRGRPASERWEAQVAPLFHAADPRGGDTALHLSGRDEHVGKVELVAVCIVAKISQATMLGLDQWCRRSAGIPGVWLRTG